MHALSVQQPFAQLIARGIKRWELRTWGTAHRGPIAIHASAAAPSYSLVSRASRDAGLWKVFTTQGWDSRRDLLELPRSAIVGTVDLVRVVRPRDLPRAAELV